MAVSIALVRDNIHKDGPSVPRVVNRAKIDFDKLLSYMDRRTGLSKDDIRSVFSHLAEALVFFLPDGHQVKTPIGTFTLNAHGDPSANAAPVSMRMQVRADRELQNRLRLASSFEIQESPALLLPTIVRVENPDPDCPGCFGRPGQILHIMGSRLGFDQRDGKQGVFLIRDTASADESRISVYSRTGTNIVDGVIPDIEEDRYRLEVRTRPTGTGIRAGCYDVPVFIAGAREST